MDLKIGLDTCTCISHTTQGITYYSWVKPRHDETHFLITFEKYDHQRNEIFQLIKANFQNSQPWIMNKNFFGYSILKRKKFVILWAIL